MLCMYRVMDRILAGIPWVDHVANAATLAFAALLLAGLYVRRRRERQLLPKNARVKALLAAADTSGGNSTYSDDALKKGLILAQVHCCWLHLHTHLHTTLRCHLAPLHLR